jgi:hypothetical protein
VELHRPLPGGLSLHLSGSADSGWHRGHSKPLGNVISRIRSTLAPSERDLYEELLVSSAVLPAHKGVHGQNTFLGQLGEEHPDRGHMLLDSCRRVRVLFDAGSNRNRLKILQAAKAGALTPIQELADGMIKTRLGLFARRPPSYQLIVKKLNRATLTSFPVHYRSRPPKQRYFIST